MATSFLAELFQNISDRGRVLLDRGNEAGSAPQKLEDFLKLCEALLSGRGEASGVALAREILKRYRALKIGDRIAFFEALANHFGVVHSQVDAAIALWQQSQSDETAAALHLAAEPKRQELFRRFNLAPNGTAALVRMREQLMDVPQRRNDFARIDADFVHLFSSWFNRGFLVLRRIDWSTPANILEKIIRYEAVHAISDWDDLRRRIASPDRRCYAFFHPALGDEPLIFVEVALTFDVPSAIEPILSSKRETVDPTRATTATFYSISNCQRGLAGVSFGNFLIKQVAEEISSELAQLSTFVTLSPIPNFSEWLARERLTDDASPFLNSEDKSLLAFLDQEGWWQKPALSERVRDPLMRAAGYYFLQGKTKNGAPRDSVARFHLGNGARLERINFLADESPKALRQSHALMVNYKYDLAAIEQNHEAYAERGEIVASNAVAGLARLAK